MKEERASTDESKQDDVVDEPARRKWMSMTQLQLLRSNAYSSIKTTPVFSPTLEEFISPMSYVLQPEVDAALFQYGIIKLSVPPEWAAIATDMDKMEREVFGKKMPVLHQAFEPVKDQPGTFVIKRAQQMSFTGKEFVKEAGTFTKMSEELWQMLLEKAKLRAGEVPDAVHQKYWRLRDQVAGAYYASDMQMTLMPAELDVWNFGQQGDKFPCLTNNKDVEVEGVNLPYLYAGSCGATFGCHTEDVDFYSLNYLHEEDTDGKKVWYSVPPKYATQLEVLAKKLYPDMYPGCGNLMRHKACLIDPLLLVDEGIPVFQTVQKMNELVITAPLAYHQGFNAGFNVAEARNLATPKWITYGLSTKRCTCTDDVDRMECVDKAYVEALCRPHLDDKLHSLSRHRGHKPVYERPDQVLPVGYMEPTPEVVVKKPPKKRQRTM